MPVFPRCRADGTIDDSRTSSSLASHALPELGCRTGFRESLTFHASRREALLKVDRGLLPPLIPLAAPLTYSLGYGYSINERMRFGAHRHQGTYAAAYQPRISTVDGQATYFEMERQNANMHELFRGYSLHRDYNYYPHLPEQVRLQLPDMVVDSEKVIVSPNKDIAAQRQKRYDQ